MTQPFGSNPDSNHPFSSPQDRQHTAPPFPLAKPTMATVFGILSIVLGGFSLLAQGFGLITILFFRKYWEDLSKQQIPFPGPLEWCAKSVALLLTFWLIYSGIRVFSGTMSGRSTFINYCVGSLLIRPIILAINLYAQYDQIQQQIQAGGVEMPPAAVTGVIAGAGLLGLVWAQAYEAAGFIVLRSKSVSQQFEAWDNVVNAERGSQTFDFS